MASPTELRKGRVIDLNGAPHLVLEALHRTQGRQAGFIQATLRNLQSGSSSTQKIRSTDSIEFLHTDTKKLELSYIDPDGYHFMDTETFEDFILPDDVIGNDKVFLTEGNSVDVLFVEGNPVSIQLPSSMVLEVAEAPEAIRGDTSSSPTKPIVTVTGLIVQTPLFIKVGDQIKISTEDKSYLGRA